MTQKIKLLIAEDELSFAETLSAITARLKSGAKSTKGRGSFWSFRGRKMTTKIKLLIAEDELSFAETLSAYFTEKGYEVHLAVSGERCLGNQARCFAAGSPI